MSIRNLTLVLSSVFAVVASVALVPVLLSAAPGRGLTSQLRSTFSNTPSIITSQLYA